MHRPFLILLWRFVALASVIVAFIGIAVPVLPTVPFLLLAAWAAGNGWPRLEQWLLGHAHFGPSIRRWREHGVVPRNVKWFASAAMAASSAILWQLVLPPWLKLGVPAVLLGVAIWLWRAPEDERR
jgi:hypothetical protein